MHSEGDIRKAIRPLLDLYGELSTPEIKKYLEEVLTFDDEDMIQSETRNEPKILQRIGNIVAHQKDERKIYIEGFMVDKSIEPAMFYPIIGKYNEAKPLEKEERKKRKIRAEKKRKQRQARKKDWLLAQKQHSELGLLGEEFVYEREREKVALFDTASVNRVIHLSREQGDGLGYDILSLNDVGEAIFIEVKTTEGGKNTPFFLSKNEKEFLEENASNDYAFIYRVYEFNSDARCGKIEVITANDLFTKYDFDSITYRVTKK